MVDSDADELVRLRPRDVEQGTVDDPPVGEVVPVDPPLPPSDETGPVAALSSDPVAQPAKALDVSLCFPAFSPVGRCEPAAEGPTAAMASSKDVFAIEVGLESCLNLADYKQFDVIDAGCGRSVDLAECSRTYMLLHCTHLRLLSAKLGVRFVSLEEVSLAVLLRR